SGATGVTIDARGYVGNQTCSVAPTIPAAVTGRILLGNATIATPGWAIPAGVELTGLGALSTTIQATSGVGVLLTMGSGTVQFGVKIKALTVDCNSQPNCIGIFNAIAEEGSTVEDVIINNASKYGLEVMLPPPGSPAPPAGSPFASNSGPYRNITIQYPTPSSCLNSTKGIYLTGGDDGRIVRGLDNITIAGCNGVGIFVQNTSTRIANSTISSSGSGGIAIQIGDTSGASPKETHNV